MKQAWRFVIIGLLFIAMFAEPNVIFAGLLTPSQLMRHNRYKITKQEFRSYKELYKTTLTNPQGYILTPKEADLVQTIENKFYSLSPRESAVYKKLSEDKCLNILLVRPGIAIYNGDVLDQVDYARIAENPPASLANTASDGQNILTAESDEEGFKDLKYNGKIIKNLRGLTYRNLTVKDGHMAYCAGPGPGTNYHHVYYDGKDMGFGTSFPVIEKDHLAYNKLPSDPAKHNDTFEHFMYDGKEYGPITTGKASLTGDHFAFLERIFPKKPMSASAPYSGEWLGQPNIEGKRYPGFFPATGHDSYVKISEKSNCKPR